MVQNKLSYAGKNFFPFFLFGNILKEKRKKKKENEVATMEMNEIMTAISTVGFPIVMCGALFWYMIQQNEKHAEETNSLKEAITELKVAIVQLVEKLKEE